MRFRPKNLKCFNCNGFIEDIVWDETGKEGPFEIWTCSKCGSYTVVLDDGIFTYKALKGEGEIYED